MVPLIVIMNLDIWMVVSSRFVNSIRNLSILSEGWNSVLKWIKFVIYGI